MSLIWIICGAGRGVGKTTLAQNLCRVLPESIYAKSGHGTVKRHKCEHYFQNLSQLRVFIKKQCNSNKHIIVESNALAKCRDGDITIFISSPIGKTSLRRDRAQLEKSADIRICPDASSLEWEKFLRDKLNSRKLCKAICDCLNAQKHYLFSPELNAHSKVWLEISGQYIFGKGLGRLLENVNRLGTLQDAAKNSQMSYRYAWNLIHSAEEHLQKKLILGRAGGSGGGNSSLSPDGLCLLNVFNQLNKDIADFTERRFSELYRQEKSNV